MNDLPKKEWFEKVPEEWNVMRMKNIMSPKEEKSTSGEEELLSVTIHEGVIKRSEYLDDDEGGSRADSLVGYKIVHKNDLVNNIMKMSFRCLGISPYDGIVSPAYSVFEIDNSRVAPKFLNYLLRINRYVHEYRKLSKGIQESRMRLYDDYFLAMDVIVPSLEEQKLIAQYLDKKTDEIDRLIEKIQKKIELLTEQRTSLINHYVTKGLDPNVEMKDSGVEWIGEIPKHWDLIKLKYLFSLEGGKDPKLVETNDGKYPIFGTGGEISRSSDFLYDKPTLLLGRKGTIDKPFIVTEPFWVSDVMYYTVQKSEINPDYLLKLFSLVPFDFYKYGSTQPSMSRIDYENMFFPIPSENERRAITNFLDDELLKLETLIEKQNKKISLLKEYRQSLISSVVTGKIRIAEDMI